MESIKNSNLRRSTNMHMDQGVSPRNQESSKAPAMVFTFFFFNKVMETTLGVIQWREKIDQAALML